MSNKGKQPLPNISLDDSDDDVSMEDMIVPDPTLPKQDAANVECDLCKRRWPARFVINIGTRDYPRYRDKPCHASARWFDKALGSQGADLKDIKEKKKSFYVIGCARFRVVSKDDEHAVITAETIVSDALTSHTDRMSALVEFLETYQADVFGEYADVVDWMAQREFVGYYVNSLLYAKQEAFDS